MKKTIQHSPITTLLAKTFGVHVLSVCVLASFACTSTAHGEGEIGNKANQNTAEGVGALSNLPDKKPGTANTGLGFEALFNDTNGKSNTATGSQALFSNTTGNDNTATGRRALASNTTGYNNTANGISALRSNTTAAYNIAIGDGALASNTVGNSNAAAGSTALYNNTTGNDNTANGDSALFFNTTGGLNTAIGDFALYRNTTGNGNIALGSGAGADLTTGDNNIDIGNYGTAAEANTIRIGGDTGSGPQTATFVAGIYGTIISDGVPVVVNASGQLGVAAGVASMSSNASVSGDIRSEVGNSKLQKKVQEQAAAISQLRSAVIRQQLAAAKQRKQIDDLTATLNQQASQIQKVSTQVELSRPTPRWVENIR